MVINIHKAFSANSRGRDLVVGDIHGCFSLLTQALKAADFKPEDDRLFAVGDIVNRGPECAQAVTWLDYPWFHAVQGNHDHMMLSATSRKKEDRKDWEQSMSDSDLNKLVKQCANMPITMQVESDIGLIGFVHAEVPEDVHWNAFVDGLNDPKSDYHQCALWDEERLTNKNTKDVEGVERVFVGHKIHDNSPVCMGNVYYMDTGAYRRVLEPIKHAMNGITVASLTTSHSTLTAPRLMPKNGISLRL